MRILILGFTKMKFMPYASFYIDRIDCKNNEVEVLYWNRDRKDENLNRYDSSIRFHEFSDCMQDSAPYARKLFHFYRYRSQALKLLKNGGFDFVIVLHTLPGILVSDYLLKHFALRYILDYRDSTFEHISFFGKMVMQLSLASKLTFVSSDAFRRFLPASGVPVITSHNILEDSLNHRDDRIHTFKASPKIRIAFWGFIRHADHNMKIIDRLGKDPRFELHYYGRKQAVAEQLETYAKSIGADNVFFHGEYNPEDRYQFACSTDIIHNSYWDNNTRLAMGNKYYDGVIFRIPQLTMPGTYMGDRCTAKGTGIALDPADADYADSIWQWFGNIDRAQFENCCDADLDAILVEYNAGKELLNGLFNSERSSDNACQASY